MGAKIFHRMVDLLGNKITSKNTDNKSYQVTADVKKWESKYIDYNFKGLFVKRIVE